MPRKKADPTPAPSATEGVATVDAQGADQPLPWEPQAPTLPGADVVPPMPDRPGAVRPVAMDLPMVPGLSDLLAEQDADDAREYDNPEAFHAALAQDDLEAAAGAESLARLHHRRRVLVANLAHLAALFEGSPPAADAMRKQHRAMVATRTALEESGQVKEVESRLERLANCHPDHVAYCQHLDGLRVLYHRGKVALQEIQERINDRAQRLRSHDGEVRAHIGTPRNAGPEV